ncbi:zinc finger protein 254-like isoform X1 [Vespula squamosa]|uniref:Zinc finger protein 254-like isoform X1 n=1 Tax=Vespula squamosa TaxID=30214 RepID=A0ABD2A261_VESSQ
MDSRYNIVTWPVYQQQNHEEKMSGLYKVPYMMYCPTIRTSQRLSSCLDRKPGCFKCPRCGKGYRWLRNMKNHLRIECGKDPKECCPYCPHRTKYKSSLQKHIQRIHFDAPLFPIMRPRLHVCPRCGQMYAWASNLRKHLKMGCGMVTFETHFSCQYCPYRSRIEASFLKHLLSVHNIK